MSAEPLLEIDRLAVEFNTRAGVARVVDQIGFSLMPGETLGIVGESGCGKSVTALAIMGLVPEPPGRVAGGAVRLKGEDLIRADTARMRQIRGNNISMIFQEPMTSLNPVFTVGDQISEAVRLHEGLSRRDAQDRAIEMLGAVHIPVPERRVDEYPHQMSGGMRQRVMIAMALACRPEILIADEPTTALDVTIQAQVFDLLAELREKTGTAIILITHDMGVIAEMADRVAVMYAGRIIETGSVEEILDDPYHPYTRGLIACVPHMQDDPPPERPPLLEISGVVPAMNELGAGCAFEPRCSERLGQCPVERPETRVIGEGRETVCWLTEEDRDGRP